MTKNELEKYRNILLAKRQQVLKELGVFQEIQKDVSDNKYSTHIAEEGSDAMVKEQAFLLASQGNKYLMSINDALKLIDDGKYGTCIECSGTIPGERLEVIPDTTLCITCKSRLEG